MGPGPGPGLGLGLGLDLGLVLGDLAPTLDGTELEDAPARLMGRAHLVSRVRRGGVSRVGRVSV